MGVSKFPPELEKGFASAKSQTIGIACLAKVSRKAPRSLIQEVIDDQRLSDRGAFRETFARQAIQRFLERLHDHSSRKLLTTRGWHLYLSQKINRQQSHPHKPLHQCRLGLGLCH